MLKLKVQFCTQRKRFEECTHNLTFHVGGDKASLSLWLRICRKFVLQNLGRSEWVRNELVLGGVRIGMIYSHCARAGKGHILFSDQSTTSILEAQRHSVLW